MSCTQTLTHMGITKKNNNKSFISLLVSRAKMFAPTPKLESLDPTAKILAITYHLIQ